jgi:hypothetical protein
MEAAIEDKTELSLWQFRFIPDGAPAGSTI